MYSINDNASNGYIHYYLFEGYLQEAENNIDMMREDIPSILKCKRHAIRDLEEWSKLLFVLFVNFILMAVNGNSDFVCELFQFLECGVCKEIGMKMRVIVFMICDHNSY